MWSGIALLMLTALPFAPNAEADLDGDASPSGRTSRSSMSTRATKRPTDPEISGSGFVLDKKQKLTELYAVGIELEVKALFPLYTTRAKKDVLGRPKVGTKVTLLAHDRKQNYFLVRSSTGLLGWVPFAELEKGVELPLAG